MVRDFSFQISKHFNLVIPFRPHLRLTTVVFLGMIFLIVGCSDKSTQSDTSDDNPKMVLESDYNTILQGMNVCLTVGINNVPNLSSVTFRIEKSDSAIIHYDSTLLSLPPGLEASLEQLDSNTFKVSEINDYDKLNDDTGYINLGRFFYSTTISSVDSILVSITATPVEMISSEGDTILVANLGPSTINIGLISTSSMLVVYWPIDDRVMDTILDFSSNNLHAQFDDVNFVSGKKGEGIEFTDFLTHMYAPDKQNIFHLLDEMTIALWVNGEHYNTQFDSDVPNILSRCDTNWNPNLAIRYKSDLNCISLFADSLYGDSMGARRIGISQYPVNDGNWHFIAFSLKLSDSTTYIAMLDTLLSYDSSNYIPYPPWHENGLMIGCGVRGMSNPDGGSFFSMYIFPGSIDEILILNRSLPYELLKQLYYSYYLE